MRTSLNPSSNVGGALVAKSNGQLGSGGSAGLGGLTGLDSVLRTGGVEGVGGLVGTAGMVTTAGTTVAGGTGGTAGTTASGPVFGTPCATDDDCPSAASCCDGFHESCDGTRVPSRDDTNSGELVVSEDGLTVTDTMTGLVWQREGDGPRAGCFDFGTFWQCPWAAAEAYCASLTLGGVSGWRLPALMELMTLVNVTKSNPAIDQTAFPNTPSNGFWTASPGTRDYRWLVRFNDGRSETATTGTEYLRTYQVRCVHGSRCYPASRFVVLSGGLVQDTLTNLIWQQQADTTGMLWAAAQTYCSNLGSGFRLPTLRELNSLVDLTVTYGGKFNQTVFPNTPPTAGGFWSSSRSAASSDFAWLVGTDGTAMSNSMGYPGSVRCVR
jgi:hypothetical protein